MNKNRSINTILLLLSLGFIAKVLSTLARVLTTRTIGIDAMGLYQLASPCMLLVITLSQFGLPTAMATLVSRHRNRAKTILISGITISFIISVVMMILVISLSKVIAINILKNPDIELTLYALALLIPLVSLSAIIKGFFLGMNEIELTSTSTIMEEVGRILFIIFFLESFASKGANFGSFGAMIGVCIGEIFQSLYMIFFNNRRLYLRVNELMAIKMKNRFDESKNILKLSFPLTLSRLIGSVTYFLESIIISNLMLKYGYTVEVLTHDYGLLSGYVMPLLLMPGFFATSFANYLLPNMSKSIGQKNYRDAKSKFKKMFFISSLTGLFFSLIFFIFGDKLMLILYGTDEGFELVKILAFPFVIYYIEAPIASAMHALNLTTKAFYATTISCIIRIVILLVFTKTLQVNSVALATIVSVLIDVIINGFFVFDRLFFHNEKIVF
ncbi:MAG: oligosaccharide flippase family protein [Erysipelotrichales bacterium]|nr:oligosaccharide flippase family protein [Erysipelotrichales bacterium]